jgi:hypothetical protein
MRTAYPPDFWDAYDRLKSGDESGIDAAVEFLEADPMCFRSGYIKADLLRFLKRMPLQEPQIRRLQKAVVRVVASRGGRELRHYVGLARQCFGPEFQQRLQVLASSDDDDVRRRARWVLHLL